MKINHLVLFLFVLGLISACSNQPEATQTPDMNMLYTLAAQTVSAQETVLALTARPSETPIPTGTASQPLLPTIALTPLSPVSLSTTAPVLSTVASTACDKAQFVADETIPDGTPISAGASFTKTWRLMNAGTCTWGTGYKAVFVSGDSLSANSPIALSQTVAPGATIDISVAMTAPSSNRTYTGYWELQNASGQNFGIGAAGNGSFYVNIVVGSGATTTGTPGTATITPTITYFAVVSASLSASQTTYSGVCPITINVTGSVTASQAGTVQYHFIRPDGSTSGGKTLTFTSGGSQSVTDSFNVGSTTSGSEAIYIDTPNRFNFGGPSIAITCTTAPTATPTPTPTPTP